MTSSSAAAAVAAHQQPNATAGTTATRRSQSNSPLDGYESLDVIGGGTFGVIRKVRRRSDGRIFARKELHFERMGERDRQQIVAEVNILRTLDHDNIVRYVERHVDAENSMLYIVMEYCEGGDLGGLIKRFRKKNALMSEDTVWSYFYQLVRALDACHFRHGDAHDVAEARFSDPTHTAILHRDLKPENVFLSDAEARVVKLGDFGLAKQVAARELACTYVGTPYYMSPELASGSRYDAKSDIWALGCVVYELCALAPPFDAQSQPELTRKIRAGHVPELPRGYSQDLGALVRGMLSLDSKRRPSTKELLRHPRLRFAQQTLEMEALSKTLQAERDRLSQLGRDLEEREARLCHEERRVREREAVVQEHVRSLEARHEELLHRSAQLEQLERRLEEQQRRASCGGDAVEATAPSSWGSTDADPPRRSSGSAESAGRHGHDAHAATMTGSATSGASARRPRRSEGLCGAPHHPFAGQVDETMASVTAGSVATTAAIGSARRLGAARRASAGLRPRISATPISPSHHGGGVVGVASASDVSVEHVRTGVTLGSPLAARERELRARERRAARVGACRTEDAASGDARQADAEPTGAKSAASSRGSGGAPVAAEAERPLDRPTSRVSSQGSDEWVEVPDEDAAVGVEEVVAARQHKEREGTAPEATERAALQLASRRRHHDASPSSSSSSAAAEFARAAASNRLPRASVGGAVLLAGAPMSVAARAAQAWRGSGHSAAASATAAATTAKTVSSSRADDSDVSMRSARDEPLSSSGGGHGDDKENLARGRFGGGAGAAAVVPSRKSVVGRVSVAVVGTLDARAAKLEASGGSDDGDHHDGDEHGRESKALVRGDDGLQAQQQQQQQQQGLSSLASRRQERSALAPRTSALASSRAAESAAEGPTKRAPPPPPPVYDMDDSDLPSPFLRKAVDRLHAKTTAAGPTAPNGVGAAGGGPSFLSRAVAASQAAKRQQQQQQRADGGVTNAAPTAGSAGAAQLDSASSVRHVAPPEAPTPATTTTTTMLRHARESSPPDAFGARRAARMGTTTTSSSSSSSSLASSSVARRPRLSGVVMGGVTVTPLGATNGAFAAAGTALAGPVVKSSSRRRSHLPPSSLRHGLGAGSGSGGEGGGGGSTVSTS